MRCVPVVVLCSKLRVGDLMSETGISTRDGGFSFTPWLLDTSKRRPIEILLIITNTIIWASFSEWVTLVEETLLVYLGSRTTWNGMGFCLSLFFRLKRIREVGSSNPSRLKEQYKPYLRPTNCNNKKNNWAEWKKKQKKEKWKTWKSGGLKCGGSWVVPRRGYGDLCKVSLSVSHCGYTWTIFASPPLREEDEYNKRKVVGVFPGGSHSTPENRFNSRKFLYSILQRLSIGTTSVMVLSWVIIALNHCPTGLVPFGGRVSEGYFWAGKQSPMTFVFRLLFLLDHY